MLAVSNLSKQFPGADAPLFRNLSFTVNSGERVALIGPNGCGKTTLLRVILGEIRADGGGVIFNPPDLRIGYLPQGLELPDATPLHDALFPQAAALRAAEPEVERLAEAIAVTPNGDLGALMDAYARRARTAGIPQSPDRFGRARAHPGRAGPGRRAAGYAGREPVRRAKNAVWDWLRCC